LLEPKFNLGLLLVHTGYGSPLRAPLARKKDGLKATPTHRNAENSPIKK